MLGAVNYMWASCVFTGATNNVQILNVQAII